MVNDRVSPALGMMYIAKNTMALADRKLITLLQEEIYRAGCSFLCGVELVVPVQQPSKVVQTPCLSHRITKTFVNPQCFFGLLDPFLVEAR